MLPIAVALCVVAGFGCRHASRQAEPAETAPPASRPAQETVVEVVDGVVAHTGRRVVEISAVTCLDVGWLEQIACSPGTREHESLMVVEAKPSAIHLALTIAGFESGEPGRWSLDGDELILVPPRGDRVRIAVRYDDAAGETVERSISAWIRDHMGERVFPDDVDWVFAGSLFAPNPEWMEPGEHYVADRTGSVVGLVTFGDEVIGFPEVLADQETVQAPEWEANADVMPPIGTPVTIVLRAP